MHFRVSVYPYAVLLIKNKNEESKEIEPIKDTTCTPALITNTAFSGEKQSNLNWIDKCTKGIIPKFIVVPWLEIPEWCLPQCRGCSLGPSSASSSPRWKARLCQILTRCRIECVSDSCYNIIKTSNMDPVCRTQPYYQQSIFLQPMSIVHCLHGKQQQHWYIPIRCDGVVVWRGSRVGSCNL